MGLINRNALGLCLALSAAGALGAGTAWASSKKVPLPHRPPVHAGAREGQAPLARAPLPRKRPQQAGGMTAFAQANVGLRGALFAGSATFKRLVRPVSGPFAIAPTISTTDADIAAVKTVIEAARKGRDADADAAERTIADPVARKLAEWAILRSDNTTPTFQRYAAFVRDNPDWPHVSLFRRRAENALWNDGIDDATVLAFFALHQPTTAKGRYALARVLLARGKREGAAALVRTAWRWQDCSAEVENKVLGMFGDLLTREDHRVRMQQRLYEDDVEAGMRAAQRLGGDDLAIAHARVAVIKRLKNAGAVLDSVPAAARRDPGYNFARVQWLRQNNKTEEAGKLVLSAPYDDAAVVNPDQWWLMRRVLVR